MDRFWSKVEKTISGKYRHRYCKACKRAAYQAKKGGAICTGGN